MQHWAIKVEYSGPFNNHIENTIRIIIDKMEDESSYDYDTEIRELLWHVKTPEEGFMWMLRFLDKLKIIERPDYVSVSVIRHMNGVRRI